MDMGFNISKKSMWIRFAQVEVHLHREFGIVLPRHVFSLGMVLNQPTDDFFVYCIQCFIEPDRWQKNLPIKESIDDMVVSLANLFSNGHFLFQLVSYINRNIRTRN